MKNIAKATVTAAVAVGVLALGGLSGCEKKEATPPAKPATPATK